MLYNSVEIAEQFGVAKSTVHGMRMRTNIPKRMTKEQAQFIVDNLNIKKKYIGHLSISVIEKLLFHWSPSLIAKEVNTSKAKVLEIQEEWIENNGYITVESKINFMV